jgi:thioesterase domain-containing protein
VRTERRRFIAKASGAIAAVAAAGIVDAPNVIAQPKVQWRMSTTWTAVFDRLQAAAQRLAKVVEEMSDLKKLSAEVVREKSEKTHMAKKVHASFTKFQALVGP